MTVSKREYLREHPYSTLLSLSFLTPKGSGQSMHPAIQTSVSFGDFFLMRTLCSQTFVSFGESFPDARPMLSVSTYDTFSVHSKFPYMLVMLRRRSTSAGCAGPPESLACASPETSLN
jgi:hypothetical protein